jgi:hypothetical protein
MKYFLLISLSLLTNVSSNAQQTYDDALDSIHTWSPLTSNELLFTRRSFINRDNDGKVIDVLSLTSYMGGPWENSNSLVFTYNNQNLIEKQEIFGWYDTIWGSWGETNFSYDTLGNLIQIYNENSRRTNTYDSINRLILSVDTRLEGNQWVDKEWITYSYNASGLLEIMHHLTHVTGGIYQEIRSVYEYDQGGRILLERVQNPLGGGLWDDVGRTVYTYSEFTTTKEHQYFNFQQWQYTNRTIYTFNSDEKVTLEQYQSWNENEWITHDSVLYYYTLETGISTVPSIKLNIYPNPASETIQLNLEEPVFNMGSLSIYAVNGIEMFNSKINSIDTKSIDVSNLPPGIYYLIVNSPISGYSQPFIKQ